MAAPLSRRMALGGFSLAALTMVGCGRDDDPRPVTVATGGPQGVYARLGAALADHWRADLGVPASAVVSEGSVDNVDMLVRASGATGQSTGAGRADVAFCAADVAVAVILDPAGPRLPLQALARVHDDAIQLVVAADSPVRRLADLAGARVSVGAPNSGVLVIAPRLLAIAGLSIERDLVAARLGLGDSISAFARGEIDAFFWSGGVPTRGVDDLAATRPVRLVDLGAETAVLRARFGVYDVTTVPARTYGLPDPIATTSIRNVLLVAATMPAARAGALTRVLLERRAELALADPAGRSIDPRSAIGTQPVPLHPGAIAAYRALKGD